MLRLCLFFESEIFFKMTENKEFYSKVYEKTADNVKQLEDIRFKLLAIVPSVSAIGIKELYAVDCESHVKVFFAILGIVITCSIFIFELRNRQIIKALNKKRIAMENEMGLTTALFEKHLQSNGIVTHRAAMNLIYITAIVSWLLFLFFTLIK
jgi:hypothetical protein